MAEPAKAHYDRHRPYDHRHDEVCYRIGRGEYDCYDKGYGRGRVEYRDHYRRYRPYRHYHRPVFIPWHIQLNF